MNMTLYAMKLHGLHVVERMINDLIRKIVYLMVLHKNIPYT